MNDTNYRVGVGLLKETEFSYSALSRILEELPDKDHPLPYVPVC